MTEEIRNEAIQQIDLDIKIGFENESELYDGILDMFYGEENFDKDWLAEYISINFKKHQNESKGWKPPTDFEKLTIAFDNLIKDNIVCYT